MKVIFRFRPRGRPIIHPAQLRDGMKVQYYFTGENRLLRGIYTGYILEKRSPWDKKYVTYYLVNSSTKQQRFLYCSNPNAGRSELPYFKIWTYNKFLERKSSMANKLLSALKLNTEQRKLSKAGVYDENGNLTEDGKELLLNFLAGEHETELVNLVQDFIKDKKKVGSKDSDD